MEAIPTLLQHGALGAIVVLQAALIYYLLKRIETLTAVIVDLTKEARQLNAFVAEVLEETVELVDEKPKRH